MIRIAILFILVYAVPCIAWETWTPMGIHIVADDEVITQFNRHWFSYGTADLFPKRPNVTEYAYGVGPKWKKIKWAKIDEFFKLLRQKYDVWPDPTRLTIRIMPIDYNCFDESPFPHNYEFSGYGYSCIDGVFPNGNLIVIHLGDDPGQPWQYGWSRPFCATALDWEFWHYFMLWKGDPCWNDEFNPYCLEKYRDVKEICQ